MVNQLNLNGCLALNVVKFSFSNNSLLCRLAIESKLRNYCYMYTVFDF